MKQDGVDAKEKKKGWMFSGYKWRDPISQEVLKTRTKQREQNESEGGKEVTRRHWSDEVGSW